MYLRSIFVAGQTIPGSKMARWDAHWLGMDLGLDHGILRFRSEDVPDRCGSNAPVQGVVVQQAGSEAGGRDTSLQGLGDVRTRFAEGEHMVIWLKTE